MRDAAYKDGPRIAQIAALIGDPARANMLTALMPGVALMASELAAEAGVTKQTASAHLAKLRGAELIALTQQGRHSYYRLSEPDVARALESLMGLAARRTPVTRTGPREPALRRARVCYDHLAGDLGVSLYDALLAGKLLRETEGGPAPTARGRDAFAAYGVDLAPLESAKRPLCRACLDWSARRTHLAGGLGAALLDSMLARKWCKRRPATRILDFTPAGEAALKRAF